MGALLAPYKLQGEQLCRRSAVFCVIRLQQKRKLGL